MNNNQLSDLGFLASKAALLSGKEIIEIYNSPDFDITTKMDNSPLTKADKAAHIIIMDYLKETNIPIISEEGKNLSYDERKDYEYYWLVDPLDGTKEFIKKNGEFTVNIALVHNQKPILGVIYAPVLESLYIGIEGIGSYKIKDVNNDNFNANDFTSLINKSKKLPINENRKELIVVGSRSHMNQETENFINKLKRTNSDIGFLSVGSSLKLCMIAEGKADVYPRYAPTMEWDTAAGNAIITASGGTVTLTNEKTSLLYNKENLLNPWFVATASK